MRLVRLAHTRIVDKGQRLADGACHSAYRRCDLGLKIPNLSDFSDHETCRSSTMGRTKREMARMCVRECVRAMICCMLAMAAQTNRRTHKQLKADRCLDVYKVLTCSYDIAVMMRARIRGGAAKINQFFLLQLPVVSFFCVKIE